jgi:hypothetical protein
LQQTPSFKLIQRLERFPFRIRQETADWCIPASIEAVTKYHKSDSTVTQGYLVTQFGDMSQIGLGSMKERVLERDDKYSWAALTYLRDTDFQLSFDKFLSSIQQYVDENKPPIISVPMGDRYWHMLTVVGYDSTHFLVYNPDPRAIHAYSPLSKSRLRIDLCLRKNARDTAIDSLILSPKEVTRA